MIIKALLTLLVVFVGGRAIFANVTVAGRTAAKMQADLGISPQEARHRATPIVVGWTVGIIAIAGGLIWTVWALF